MVVPKPVVTLAHLGGYPVRLILADAPDAQWMGRLLPSSAGMLMVEVEPPRILPWPLDVYVEIGHASLVYRFRSVVSSLSGYPARLRLEQPEKVDVVQRRQHPRAGLSSRLVFWLAAAGPDENRSGRAYDVSPLALAFITESPPVLGSEIEFHFLDEPLDSLGLLRAHTLRVTREVENWWVTVVAFAGLPEPAQATLAQFLEDETWLDSWWR